MGDLLLSAPMLRAVILSSFREGSTLCPGPDLGVGRIMVLPLHWPVEEIADFCAINGPVLQDFLIAELYLLLAHACIGAEEDG